MEIYRSLYFSLEKANTGKKKILNDLWEEYRKALQYFIDWGYCHKQLPRYTVVKMYPLTTRLNATYLVQIMREACRILRSSHLKAKTVPRIQNTSLRLNNNVAILESGKNDFDYWLKIRIPWMQKWVYYPLKDYEYAKKI